NAASKTAEEGSIPSGPAKCYRVGSRRRSCSSPCEERQVHRSPASPFRPCTRAREALFRDTGMCSGLRSCLASKTRGFDSLHLHSALIARRSSSRLVCGRREFDSRSGLRAGVLKVRALPSKQKRVSSILTVRSTRLPHGAERPCQGSTGGFDSLQPLWFFLKEGGSAMAQENIDNFIEGLVLVRDKIKGSSFYNSSADSA